MVAVNDGAVIGLIAAVLTALLAASATVWSKRKQGPEAQTALVNASVLLLSQLQARVAILEEQVTQLEHEVKALEAENLTYLKRFGPIQDDH